jgi:hypothetical protein
MQEQETIEGGAVPFSELQNRPRLPEQHEVGVGNGHDNCVRCGPKAVHDLLSPLCTIASLGAWLVDEYSDRLGPDGREWLNRLQESVERLRAVIENWPHSPVVDDACRDFRNLPGCPRPDSNEILL